MHCGIGSQRYCGLYCYIATHSTAEKLVSIWTYVEARYRASYCSYSFGGLVLYDQWTFASLLIIYKCILRWEMHYYVYIF